jgi:hypothetical protein
MVGVEDRNEDVVEEEAYRPSSVPDAAAPVPAPSAEDGGVIFVLEKASLEAAKVGKVKKTKETPSPFLSGEEGGEFFFRGEREKGLKIERSCCNGIGPQEWIGNISSSSYKISSWRYFELAARAATMAQGQ